MPEITFIFGPNNSFFFDCPKSWKFHNIPTTLRQLFNSSMSPAWRIAQPYCLALAPQINSPEPVWYIGCKTLNGEDKIFYSQNFFDINYPDLSRWQKTIPNAPRSCFVTFGAGYSYFASAPGRGSVWAGIPSELSDKVQKAYDTPCCVALGMHDAWFVMWQDGYYSWKFYGHYGGLDRILTDAEPRSVSYLAISPYNKEHYFVAFRDRTVKYNFTGAPHEWMQQMQEVFHQWQAEVARAQQPFPQQYAAPNNVPYAPQQWNPNLAQAPPNSGFLSPQTPNTPTSSYSNATSPPMSPNPPYMYPYPAQNRAYEMPGSIPAGPTAPSAVPPQVPAAAPVAPPPPPPGPTLGVPPQAVQRTTSTEKKKKFLSKIFD